MNKTTCCILIDRDNKRWAEDNIKNLSGWVNEQLSTLKKMQSNPTEIQKEITDLESEINQLNSKKKHIENEITLKYSIISNKKEQSEKEDKEQMEEVNRRMESIQNVDPLQRADLQ